MSNEQESNEQILARQLDDLKFKLNSGIWVRTLHRNPDLAGKMLKLVNKDTTLAEMVTLAPETKALATKLYLQAVQQPTQ